MRAKQVHVERDVLTAERWREVQKAGDGGEREPLLNRGHASREGAHRLRPRHPLGVDKGKCRLDHSSRRPVVGP